MFQGSQIGDVVPGYDIEHRYTRDTCISRTSNKIKEIWIEEYDPLQCAKECDADSSCNFFFINDYRWCAFYKSCTNRGKLWYPGTTYQKIN